MLTQKHNYYSSLPNSLLSTIHSDHGSATAVRTTNNTSFPNFPETHFFRHFPFSPPPYARPAVHPSRIPPPLRNLRRRAFLLPRCSLSLLYSPHLRHFFLSLLLSALLDLIVIGLTKHLIQRPRPVYNKNMSLTVSVDHWSFPSGHSSRVFMISTFTFLCWDEFYQMLLKFAPFEREHFANFVWVLWGWALATSVSRILLGRHFVFDVIVGASVGVLEGLFAVRFLKLSQVAVSL